MSRYMIRADATNKWMVWDRELRCPASIEGRKLVNLARDAAQAHLTILSGNGVHLPLNKERWQIRCAQGTFNCGDETSAKATAKMLIGKGRKVTARLIQGDVIIRTIENDDGVRFWLGDADFPDS